MTQTTNRRPFHYTALLALAAALICAIGALAAVALTVQLSRAATPAPVAEMHRIDAIPAEQFSVPGTAPVPAEVDPLVAAVFGGQTDYTTVQADRIHQAADRVCEGFTAQVPLVVMEPELVQEFDMTGEQAHEFVQVAHAQQCPLA
jgi:hypothetical protein